ncbi:MAG: hypothetical protein FWD03_07940 [Defluviitaleaceae bacterium]|nr:hypothetical protein [Defluviitaleaceae bacterium]
MKNKNEPGSHRALNTYSRRFISLMIGIILLTSTVAYAFDGAPSEGYDSSTAQVVEVEESISVDSVTDDSDNDNNEVIHNPSDENEYEEDCHHTHDDLDDIEEMPYDDEDESNYNYSDTDYDETEEKAYYCNEDEETEKNDIESIASEMVDYAVFISFAEDYTDLEALFIDQGSDYNLLEGVNAVDQHGEPVTPFFVLNDDGFDVDAAFPDNRFIVRYGAIHPATSELFTRERVVYVVVPFVAMHHNNISQQNRTIRTVTFHPQQGSLAHGHQATRQVGQGSTIADDWLDPYLLNQNVLWPRSAPHATRLNSTLVGWWTHPDGPLENAANRFTLPGTPIIDGAGAHPNWSTTVVSQDLDVYAFWVYRVTFYPNTGAGWGTPTTRDVPVTASTLTVGNSGFPSTWSGGNPSPGMVLVEHRPGYIFEGWFDTPNAEGGNEFLHDTIVNANTTLWARWAPDSNNPPTPGPVLPVASRITITNYPSTVNPIAQFPSNPHMGYIGDQVIMFPGLASGWDFVGWAYGDDITFGQSGSVNAGNFISTSLIFTYTKHLANAHIVALWEPQGGGQTHNLTISNYPMGLTHTGQTPAGGIQLQVDDEINLNAGTARVWRDGWATSGIFLGWAYASEVPFGPFTGIGTNRTINFISTNAQFTYTKTHAAETHIVAVWDAQLTASPSITVDLTITNFPTNAVPTGQSPVVGTTSLSAGSNVTLAAGTMPADWVFVGWAYAPYMGGVVAYPRIGGRHTYILNLESDLDLVAVWMPPLNAGGGNNNNVIPPPDSGNNSGGNNSNPGNGDQGDNNNNPGDGDQGGNDSNPGNNNNTPNRPTRPNRPDRPATDDPETTPPSQEDGGDTNEDPLDETDDGDDQPELDDEEYIVLPDAGITVTPPDLDNEIHNEVANDVAPDTNIEEDTPSTENLLDYNLGPIIAAPAPTLNNFENDPVVVLQPENAYEDDPIVVNDDDNSFIDNIVQTITEIPEQVQVIIPPEVRELISMPNILRLALGNPVSLVVTEIIEYEEAASSGTLSPVRLLSGAFNAVFEFFGTVFFFLEGLFGMNAPTDEIAPEAVGVNDIIASSVAHTAQMIMGH